MKPEFLLAYASQNGLDGVETAEAEVVEILYRVASKVAPKFRFGYLENEDIIQEAVVFALEAIEDASYDVSKPLENFMRSHMRNRTHNYKRNTFARNEPPCGCCSPEYPPEAPCLRFQKWLKLNNDKKNLTQSSSTTEFDVESYAESSEGRVEFFELIAKIDEFLPMEYRSDYLRMRDGIPIPKTRRVKIREFLKELLSDGGE